MGTVRIRYWHEVDVFSTASDGYTLEGVSVRSRGKVHRLGLRQAEDLIRSLNRVSARDSGTGDDRGRRAEQSAGG